MAAAWLLAGALGTACGTTAWPTPRGPGSVEGQVAETAGVERGTRPRIVFHERLGRLADKYRSGVSIELGKPPLPELQPVPQDIGVTFHNRSSVYHRIFSRSESLGFDLGVLGPDQRTQTYFARSGLARWFCSLHPREGGWLFVSPTDHVSAVRTDGSFQIPEVPPGRYRLRVWDTDQQAAIFSDDFRVLPGQATQVSVEASLRE